ncbi:alpha/beta hydrolase [Limosilactobacillus caecicola]|uniref:alpha/beta hydrolase n=1 Tax=Limosilactobacillus caecicola TaxID=2941332 RepID=UPI00203AA064|nr:alpha/beta hydrolase fold domain-containing protein [Limosilactobacillus caecicola]
MKFTTQSTVGEVRDYFGGNAGRLLFPVDRRFQDNETLAQISDSRHYLWYSALSADTTVAVANYLADQAKNHPIFYHIYSEAEMATDTTKRNVGIYFFAGRPGAPFAINNAGGGFYYVAGMQDSFPHAMKISQEGDNAFALIYRPDQPYADLARAITYIIDHADELQVDPHHYSLWGGSAGARMAAKLGNRESLQRLTGRTDLPQADAVIMQYTGYDRVSPADAPTYANVGDQDWIANWQTMKWRLSFLQNEQIPTEFHVYPGLQHGFGIGTGTVAEGWLNDAVHFWHQQIELSKG